MTLVEVLAAVEVLSEADCKTVRAAANTRARSLEVVRVEAETRARFNYFASFPLGTKIQYSNDSAHMDAIAERLGFATSRTYELRQVKRGRKHVGLFLAERFDDPPKEWTWVPASHLLSTRWFVVKTPT